MEKKQTKAGGRFVIRWVLRLFLLAAAAAGAYGGYRYYEYNLPEQKLARALAQADTQMQERDYAGAQQTYTAALLIDPESGEAYTGYLRSRMQQADALASSQDIPDRSAACGIYEEISLQAEEKNVPGTASIRKEAEEKIVRLQEEIAASYDALEVVTVTEDRSGEAVLPDGTQVPYIWYYDLVKVSDEYYPYAEKINDDLAQGMDLFFADGSSDPSLVIAGTKDTGGSFRDYVGVAGTYSADGLLSIRMAEVRVHGNVQSTYYRGRTYRLSDAERVTLQDLTGRSDSGLRRLVRRRIWKWLEKEGYRDIPKADVEAYVENTRPEDFKFCILEEGGICLIVDQEAPFFASASEILQIPIDPEE